MKASRQLKPAGLALGALLACTLAQTAGAQTAPSASSPPPAPQATAATPTDQPLTLSPFVVTGNNNDGYRTNDTTSGSMMATALINLPLTIDVINREFMDDANILSVAEATKFVAGVTYAQQTGTYDSDSYSVRGFDTDQELRNGIYFHGTTDEVNVDRVEIVKGPAAILYGSIAPGGIVNYITKQPTPVASSSVDYTNGSYDYNRVAIDVNQPLDASGTVLFRLPASFTRSESPIAFVNDDATFLDPTLVFRPNPKTTVTIDYTYKRDQGTFNRGGFIQTDGPPVNGTNYLMPATGPYAAYASPFSWGEVGPYDHSVSEHTYGEIRVDQVISDNLGAQFIFSQENLRAYDDGHFMAITPFPQYAAEFTGYNLPASEMELENEDFVERYQLMERHYEFNVFWKQDLGSFQNKLILGMEGSELPNYNIQFYWPGSFPAIYPALNAPVDVRYSRAGPDSSFVPWFNFTDPLATSLLLGGWGQPDVYFTDQLSGLNDQLHVLLGLRDQEFTDLQEHKLIPQVGVIYAFTSSLSAYATYSQSAVTNGVSTATANLGQPRPIQTSQGGDAGLKASFLDGRLSGSIAVYDIQKTNVAYSDLTGFIGNNGKLLGGDSVYIAGAEESKGVEFEMQAKPTPQTQISLEYAHDSALDTKDGPQDQGAALPGAVKDSITVLGKYSFSNGLEFGAGGVFNFGTIPFAFPSSNNYYTDIQIGNTQDILVFAHYKTKIFGRPVELGVTCKNITDDHYYSSQFTPAPPREYFASIKVNF